MTHNGFKNKKKTKTVDIDLLRILTYIVTITVFNEYRNYYYNIDVISTRKTLI